MRVRADASGKSFHRKPTLETCLSEAEEQVRLLRDESNNDSSGSTRREKAAKERHASERKDRIQSALEQIQDVRDKAEKRKKGDGDKARCSTTDPDARRMKMADGGFRPAFNVQFATTADSRVIVGVEVTNSGSDSGLVGPMLDQVEERFGVRPSEALVDFSAKSSSFCCTSGAARKPAILRATSGVRHSLTGSRSSSTIGKREDCTMA